MRRLSSVAWVVLIFTGGCATMDESVIEPPEKRIPELARRIEPAPTPRKRVEAPRPIEPLPAPGPRLQTRTIGYSVRRQPIDMTVFGDGGAPLLVVGAVHGDEAASAYVAQKLIDLLRDNPRLVQGRTVAIIPVANPDGFDGGTRHNARGVDLNRNFPASNWRLNGRRHGRGPASEPETQALVNIVDELRPTAIISIHQIHGSRWCNNFDGPADWIAKLMRQHNQYPVKPSIGYPTPGSMGTWAGKERRIPIITLELPRNLAYNDCWKQNRDALLAVIRNVGGVAK